MMLKPKAARRLILVGVVIVLGILAITLLFGVRRWQNERRTNQLRVDGMAAFAKADYPGTILNLSKLLRRTPQDREAWLALAQARENVEESGGKHLAMAAGAYSRAWTLDESDTKTGRKLLRLYNEIGQAVEARDLAVRLRPANLDAVNQTHVDVLLEEAAARIALKAFDATLEQLTRRLTEIDPAGYRAAALRVECLLGSGRPDEALTFANEKRASLAADPTFEFLQQFVLLKTGKIPDAGAMLASICKVAGLDAKTAKRTQEPVYTDPAFAGQLVSLFDTIGLYGHSVLVLNDAATRLHDPMSMRLLARRYWYSGLASLIVSQAAPGPSSSAAGVSELLAFKALALRDLNRVPEAVAVLAELNTRKGDYAAAAWSRVLPTVLEKLEDKESLDRLDIAIKEHPAEPVFAYLRGEVLLRLGRSDQARETWAGVYSSNLAVGWTGPAIRIVETLLDEGRTEEGLKASERASAQFRSNPAVNLVSIRAQAMSIESGRLGGSPEEMLRSIDASLEQISKIESPDLLVRARRMLLPARVTLLVRLNRKQDAITVVERETADPGFADPDLTSRLARVSARLGLGLESGALGRAMAAGMPGADLQSRAVLLWLSGKPDEAIRMVDSALESAPAPEKEAAAIVRANVHDLLDRPDALDVWKQTLAEYRQSRAAYLAAIRSRSAAAHLEFVEQIAARLTELGCSDPDRPSSDVRLARARASLASSKSPAQRAEAIAMFKAISVDFPDRQEIRESLIDAMLMEDLERNIKPDLDGAVEQLKAIGAESADRAVYVLKVADVLRKQGRASDAVKELASLSIDPNVQASLRLDAVDRLSELGAFEPALRGVDSLIPQSGPVPANILFRRAALLGSLRRDRESLAVYHDLLDQPIKDARLIASVAASLKAMGDSAGLAKAMAKLNDPSIDPKERALARASLASGADDKSALEEFTRACELAPGDPQVWSALVKHHLRRNELAEAQAAVLRALKQIPDNPELEVLHQQVLIAGQSEETADLTPLADALARNPSTARRAEAIRAVAAARSSKQLGDRSALVRLADEFVDDSTTQLFVARRLMESDPPQVADAARIMRRAAARYAADAEVQQQAARTLMGAGDWEAALAAATTWRALERSPSSDLAVAESLLALGRARQSLESVRDAKLPARIEPTDALAMGLLNVRFRANLMLSNAAAASQVIQPYLRDSAVVRTRIALPAVAALAKDAAEVKDLLRVITQACDKDSEDEQLAIVRAWSTAASRLRPATAELLKEAGAVSAALCQAKPSAKTLEAHARVLQRMGDLPAALSAARQAAAMSPDAPAALIAVSQIVVASHGDPAEAVSNAQRAVAVTSGGVSALNTLLNARVYLFLSLQSKGDAEARRAARRDALEVLQQLASKTISDYRIVFEMANCAEQLEDIPAAIGLYERVLAMPGGPSGLDLAATKNNLAFLLLDQNRTGTPGEALFRAKSLAEDAVRLSDLATFYETLGSINARLADRPAAIAAYRRALDTDASQLAAAVGLAGLLAEGSQPEREEAAKIIERVGTEVSKGAVLQPQRSEQFNQIRKSLSAR
ncbi:MAG: hypothetical protein JSR77_11560 [Planctomycetes bacterium]|nr:hypothetical protein [Planctomycetota bacterium]